MNTFIRCISEDMSIDPVDGSEVLANAKDVFAIIAFSEFKPSNSGLATKETSVAAYELLQDATFSQMFGELNVDIDSLCFTEHQTKSFLRKYREWVWTGAGTTFFLLKSRHGHSVAVVRSGSAGSLILGVSSFKSRYKWCAKNRARIVVPKV